MTDPERLGGDRADPIEARLLEAARDYHVSPLTRRRTLAAVGLTSSLGAGAIAGKAAASIALKKILLIVATSAGVGAVGLVVANTVRAPSAVNRASPPAATPGIDTGPRELPRPPAARSPVPRASAESDGTTAGAAEERRASSSRARAARSVSGRDRAGAQTDSLSAEVALLDEARAALRGRKPARALDSLVRYREQFPKGRLRLEASVMRMEALAQNGQTVAAAEEARAFLKLHPKSALAARVERLAEP